MSLIVGGDYYFLLSEQLMKWEFQSNTIRLIWWTVIQIILAY